MQVTRLDFTRDYINLHQHIIKMCLNVSKNLKNYMRDPRFVPEIFHNPTSPHLYLSFKYAAHGIIFKRKITVKNDKVIFLGKTIVVGAQYSTNLRKPFKEEMFDEMLPFLDAGQISVIQKNLKVLYRMRCAQVMNRRGVMKSEKEEE